jgi:hypothetical protein
MWKRILAEMQSAARICDEAGALAGQHRHSTVTIEGTQKIAATRFWHLHNAPTEGELPRHEIDCTYFAFGRTAGFTRDRDWV